MNPFTLVQKHVALPKVAAPPLAGLSISVPKPKPITEDEVILRLLELQRVHAAATPKKAGDAIVEGDEVCFTALGYAKGKLVPRSPQFEAWSTAGKNSSLPELTQALCVAKVGDKLKVKLTLPGTFHVPELRNVPAVYLVEVIAAQALVLPAADDPAFLAKLGASTVKEAFTRISEDLVAKHTLKATFDALELSIEAISRRAEVKISAALLKQEVWSFWREAEGKALSEHGLVGDEQTESFESWQGDPSVVADIERRLRNSIVLGALAEAHASELTPARIVQAARRWSTLLGVPDEELLAAAETRGEERKELAQVLVQIATAELVMEQADITWV
jgi:trigger factor